MFGVRVFGVRVCERRVRLCVVMCAVAVLVVV